MFLKLKKSQDLIFNNTYLLKNKISSGSFGDVYICEHLQTKEELAIKLEEVSKNEDDLRSVLRESTLLEKIANLKGIPRILWSGTEHNYDALVMELLGNDLAALLKIHKKLSLKTICMLANQLIPLIEQIHEKNIIHRDIKPENILIGKGENSNVVYIIDFGISKYFRDMHGRHIIYRENKPFIGTTRYASISSHKGVELARKDDLESLGYMMLFLKNGGLPWQNLVINEKEKNKVVGKMKEKISNKELCKDFPAEMVAFFDYVKGMNFKDEPDYNYLRSLFIKIAQDNHFDLEDNVWDWSKEKEPLVLKENNNKPKILSTKVSDEEEEGKKMFSYLVINKKNEKRKLPGGQKEVVTSMKILPKSETTNNECLLIPPTDIRRNNMRQNSFTGSVLSSYNSVENYYMPSHIYLKNPVEYEDGKFFYDNGFFRFIYHIFTFFF